MAKRASYCVRIARVVAAGRPAPSCPVLSCPVLSCPVLSCPVLACPPRHATGSDLAMLARRDFSVSERTASTIVFCERRTKETFLIAAQRRREGGKGAG
ncbi:hypothetical protein IWZ03DRAFT_236990 [Phyllosticta citriasiana]|uniref:Secreted protein n=1 Tax=Phyllosticta citriasiana TaxID=595635 RepID=A0ABR1KEX8_9PEZI